LEEVKDDGGSSHKIRKGYVDTTLSEAVEFEDYPREPELHPSEQSSFLDCKLAKSPLFRGALMLGLMRNE
jgi:hypothetical protein